MFAQSTNILVVDDSPNIRRVISDSLNRLGFKKIQTAGDTTDALSKMEECEAKDAPIELILSDLNMPGPNGLEFLKHIRASEKYKNLPFILVTTESEKGAVIEAAVSGVSGYVVKPFNLDTLTKRLQEAYDKHSA